MLQDRDNLRQVAYHSRQVERSRERLPYKIVAIGAIAASCTTQILVHHGLSNSRLRVAYIICCGGWRASTAASAETVVLFLSICKMLSMQSRTSIAQESRSSSSPTHMARCDEFENICGIICNWCNLSSRSSWSIQILKLLARPFALARVTSAMPMSPLFEGT